MDLEALRVAKDYRDESARYFIELCADARRAGYSWRQIGKAAGIDPTAALRLVQRAQARVDISS